MKLKSWGNYPIIEGETHRFDSVHQLEKILSAPKNIIPYGNGRSYGDSALSREQILVKPYHYFLSFDEINGVLRCQAGTLLADILESFVPRGWFLFVTPGTRFVTVGGAIASDVHGKNHHVAGTFSDHIIEFTIMLPDGETVICSHDNNIELFRATCGGMGLTGVILEATIQLQPISSALISQTTIKTANLKETFDAFEHYGDSTYSVAWIDCLTRGEALGRCLLFTGEHSEHGSLAYESRIKIDIPVPFPGPTLNHYSIKAFNAIYYHKVTSANSSQQVDLNSFFYPLDAIGHWNRIYGKQGFLQYQFVLPKKASYEGLKQILSHIAASGKGSFLAVLKLFGKANSNYLSFPMEGYTLALDFKIESGIFELLDQLDEIVVEFGGRFYLAKDARVSQRIFETGYPAIEKFRNIRKTLHATEKFNSIQSKRVGI